MNLVFGDKKQATICHWLEDDRKTFARLTFLEKHCTSDSQKETIDEIKKLREDNKYSRKDIVILNKAKIKDYIQELVTPLLMHQRKYYETNYDNVVSEKRAIEVQKTTAFLKKRNLLDPSKTVLPTF